jgi:hypothetical protein
MSTRLAYRRIDVSPSVRFYSSPGLKPAARLGTAEDYSKAREALPTWCLDGLVCVRDIHAEPFVLLAIRGDSGPEDGPFRGEPWVVGGKWDMVTPWEKFVVQKARKELFAGRPVGMTVGGPIGGQLFATGWGKDTDGPFGRQGVTLQYCYQLVLKPTLTELPVRTDDAHRGYQLLSRAHSLSDLHPYIRDVIEMSGWLAKP